MNLCKNDCGFSEPQYEQVIEKETTPTKSLNNNNITPTKSSSRYAGKIKALDGIWLELKNVQQTFTESKGNNSVGGSSGGSGGIVSCLPIMRESASLLGKGNSNGIRLDCTQLGPIHRKSHQRIISLKNLFSNTPKFQKSFQRGVFLTCLIYSEDKILVTLADDILPTFQIDEDLSSSFQHDFHWFHKISTIWHDAKFLKQEMEKCDSASTLHFRQKMLQTVVTMQDSLDLRDLGKVFYKPIATNNVTFICTVNHLRSTKLVSAPNLRWTPVDKFKARKINIDNYQVLSNNSQNLMLYHQMINIPLGKGLYLAYFKLVTSVDLLKLIVPEKTPSVIPHVKIRNNPQVTRTEWELFSSINLSSINQESRKVMLTESQLLLRQQLESSLKKLFYNLKIDRNSALNHRFYTTEVIEVSTSVTLIILLPPQEESCLLEGDEKDLKMMEGNKLMTLPIQIFEMTHMLTYHNTLARRLMRLSSNLEVETVLAQHNRRKAFSSDEMSQTQNQLLTLTTLQSKLEQSWKGCRWILEVVKAARAKDRNFISLRDFLNLYNNSSSTSGGNSPSKKFPKGTYINGAQVQYSRHQLQQLLNLTKNINPEHISDKMQLLPELPGPSIPSNPNFKYESSSSLPIVGKASAKHFDRLRTTASLFDMKVQTTISSNNDSSSEMNLKNSVEAFMELSLQDDNEEQPPHYQNIKDIREDSGAYPEYQNTSFHKNNNTIPNQPMDSYMRHTSSRSKLVSLSKFSVTYPKEPVPGTNDPIGLRTLSWTKQRTSLDRSFNLNTCSTLSNSSSRELLSQDELSETETDGSVKNASAFHPHMNKIVEIYAAYDCGLCTGTCVRFQISWDTTSRQIIHLLITKLNDEVKNKGGGVVYDSVDEFCLVSVIGARERVLRMDYKPLRLQKPWDCARLFVRKKQDVTLAVSLEAKITSCSYPVTI